MIFLKFYRMLFRFLKLIKKSFLFFFHCSRNFIGRKRQNQVNLKQVLDDILGRTLCIYMYIMRNWFSL